jgi:flagellin
LENQKETYSMPLTVLNNISSLTAQNALSNTQMNLQKTLGQLSTGLKINSGSDDAAGLSIANGMQANIAALTQSQQNASNGIGMLQTADGALSQVTSLLNRAVTLATEGSTSNITSGQYTALNNEFTSIMNEVTQIGNTTNFNGANVFSSNTPTSFSSTQASLATNSALATGQSMTIQDNSGGTFVFKTGATTTVNDLINSVAAAVTDGTLSANVTATITSGKLVIAEGTTDAGINITTNIAELGPMAAAAGTANTNTVYMGDGVTSGAANTTITTSIPALTTTSLSLNSDTLNSASASQTALAHLTSAINTIAGTRGTIGASINRLNAASAVMSNDVQNLQSATNSIQNADIGKTVANMTQYNVLQSTGMAALQQSNQAQQAVLKLVQ